MISKTIGLKGVHYFQTHPYSYGLEGPFVDGEHDVLPFLNMVIFRSHVK